jgi:GT2 family glycosyltransferase
MNYALIYTIIVTYNAERWIRLCLDSLRQSKMGCAVIVVDNHSADRTVSIITEEYPEVVLVAQQENLGFGAANNIGIRVALQAGADYVFLLNQDARVEADTLSALVEYAGRYPQYGILSPMQYAEEGVLDRNFALYLQAGISQYGEQDPVQQVDFVNAAVWLISSRILLNIGVFSPLFHHYGEDNNFSDRILFYKYNIGVVKEVKAFHDRPQSVSFPKGQINYLIRRFRLKILITMAHPGRKYGDSLRRWLIEVFSEPMGGFYKSLLLRLITIIICIPYLLFHWRKIDSYRSQSRAKGAFI